MQNRGIYNKNGLGCLVATSILFFVFLFSSSASSLTYQSSVGVNFTFNSALNVSLSGNLVINNLTPGSSSDSNVIDVSVSTNASYGYVLSATVGQKNGTSSLVNNTSSNNTFTNLNANKASLSNFTDNTWGYSYSVDNGTNWVSGSTGSTVSGYNGLPLDNNDNAEERGKGGITLISTDNPLDNQTIKFKIGAKASTSQPAGTYTNTINFYAVANAIPDFLYDKVAEMSKGTLAANNVLLTDAIQTPTTDDYTTDTSNSGVYQYDPNVYGVASDASNSYPIYFYRGILENNPGTYGSEGSAVTYPNYVKLSNDTCWRIVRTTGSGGVKMIYSGVWSGGTCSKSGSDSQVTTQSFASRGSSTSTRYWEENIAYVGYTFNNDVTDIDAYTDVNIVFGSDSNPLLNNTRSNIKTYIEDTWYENSMTSYTDILERSAGYCNDRTIFSNISPNPTPLVSIRPFTGTYSIAYFGAKERDEVSGIVPSLNCPRSVVDLYQYVPESAGVSNELKYPTALLTADEAILSGNGGTTPYSAQSYLSTDVAFWLLTPSSRASNGAASVYRIDRYLGGGYVSRTDDGVRPVISLIHSTTISSGSGTATDPWLINE